MINEGEFQAFVILILTGITLLFYVLHKVRYDRDADESNFELKVEEPIVAEDDADVENDPYSEYRSLRKLNPYPQYGEYIRFTNLVIESGYNTPYTEIDELIVSRFGIFCIEQKDHQGIVLGQKSQLEWVQCMRSYKGKLMNPGHQNYKHRKALEKLLEGRLHSSIHTYSYFPKVYKLKTDDELAFTSHDDLWQSIRKHDRQLYTFDEVCSIAKILAHESSRKENRMIIHIATLKYHLESVAAYTAKKS